MLEEINSTVSWLRLACLPELPTLTAVELLKKYESPEALFEAGPQALAPYGGMNLVRLFQRAFSRDINERVEVALSWLRQTKDGRLLKITDPEYPQALIHAGMAPLVLFTRGDLSLLNEKKMGVFGSQWPDSEGLMNARQFGSSFRRYQIAVVSSLSSGIEKTLVRAMMTASRVPVIVWGSSGPDSIYPKENVDMLDCIVQRGGLYLTAEFPGIKSSALSISKRAALSVALSDGVFILQASGHSHTMTVARHAADFNKEVFVIPGSIHSPMYKGSHRLLRQGAKLTESLADIFGSL